MWKSRWILILAVACGCASSLSTAIPNTIVTAAANPTTAVPEVTPELELDPDLALEPELEPGPELALDPVVVPDLESQPGVELQRSLVASYPSYAFGSGSG